MKIIIRPAIPSDIPAILKIVNYNIANTSALYDYDQKTLEDMKQWFADKKVGNWPVIVAEYEGILTGYASYGPFRFKDGYKYTVEHSVYVEKEYPGKGIGGQLLKELIQIATSQGYHTMIGGIDAGNEGSIAFHKKHGFTEAGLLKQTGYKFGRWLDLLFMQLMLK